MRGGPADPDELEALGAPEHIRERARAEMDILPENWAAVMVFQRCDGQWRRAGMHGRRMGLDYTAVEAVMRMRGIPPEDQGRVLDQIIIMEREVRRLDAEES